MRRTVAVLLSVTAIGCALDGCSAGALQTSAPPRDFTAAASTVIYDCGGVAQVQPRGITLFCGDGGTFVSAIRWSHWGTATATGTGDDVVNLCRPDCAAGHTKSEPVTLTATGLSLVGTSAGYTSLTIEGPGATASRFSLTINGPVLK